MSAGFLPNSSQCLSVALSCFPPCCSIVQHFRAVTGILSIVFVCLNICAHPQDPFLSLNSEVTQLSLTWQKCLAHPLEQGGMAWRVPVAVTPWCLALLPIFCLVCEQTESVQTTCSISALGMALINDGQVKRERIERNFWGYWRSVALLFLHLPLSFHLCLERQKICRGIVQSRTIF